jgi:hypothetical protein
LGGCTGGIQEINETPWAIVADDPEWNAQARIEEAIEKYFENN